MGPLTGTKRSVRKSVSAIVIMAASFTLAATLGFAAAPGPETIQANYFQAGNAVGVTLIVYNPSTALTWRSFRRPSRRARIGNWQPRSQRPRR